MALARISRHPALVQVDLKPVAVVLDFVQPVVAGAFDLSVAS
jgi:hypothetical protein